MCPMPDNVKPLPFPEGRCCTTFVKLKVENLSNELPQI